MLRWILKKGILCLVLLLLFSYLNEKNPQWMQSLGRWIGGEVGNKVSVAVSRMLEQAEEKGVLEGVVEVFREETPG